jgi:formylglycine-generating enzyme required for sulfatase activity
MSVRRTVDLSLLILILIGFAVPICAQEAKGPAPKDGPLEMKFVPLPKATFFMGWDGAERPGKKMEMKEDFEIAIYPVTQGQWQKLMGKKRGLRRPGFR